MVGWQTKMSVLCWFCTSQLNLLLSVLLLCLKSLLGRDDTRLDSSAKAQPTVYLEIIL